MRDTPEWIIVGRIKRAHGKAGELLVDSLTDFGERYEPGAELYLEPRDEKEKRLVTVVSSRPANQDVIIRLDGINSREEAMDFTAADLFIPFTAVKPSGSDSFYSFELEGCRVFQGGELVGSVKALVESRANPYLEVEQEGGTTTLIPFVKDVVGLIDTTAGRIEIREDFLR